MCVVRRKHKLSASQRRRALCGPVVVDRAGAAMNPIAKLKSLRVSKKDAFFKAVETGNLKKVVPTT